MEELPIRDVIYFRYDDMLPKQDIANNDIMSKEVDLVEYSRSLMLSTLNNLISVYGQDMKNKQWVLEPFADIVISFAVMYMGMLRYIQLDENSHKNNTVPVLKYSIDRHFKKLYKNVVEVNTFILESLDDYNKTYYNDLLNKFDEIEYKCDSIKLKQEICSEFYKQGKYYLD